MTIRNLREAEAALRPYVPLAKQLTGKDTTLDRIRPLMKLLGNPQDRLKVIHIAGTSGKTSTAYYMAALLAAGGQQVGLTVSPHVDNITERVQINGRPISEADFCEELGKFLNIIEKVGLKPSYFELLYAFVIWVLDKRKIGYAVVETGLGGLHDATNVVTRPDKVCVITDIGFDHKDLLGDTLSEIAAQKAGIIHERNHVFMYRQDKTVMTAVKERADRHQAPLHVVNEPNEKQRNDLPAYQQRNWWLAYQVYEHLRKRDNLPNLASQALAKTQQISIPGRMEIKHVKDKTLVMDGAHNAQKITTFIDSFRQLYPETKPAVLVALKDDKDYLDVAPLLAPLAARLIVTTFDTTQDLPVKSMDPGKLAEAFRAAGAANVKVIVDSNAALRTLLAAPEKVCVIAGSFYLLGQIRNNVSL